MVWYRGKGNRVPVALSYPKISCVPPPGVVSKHDEVNWVRDTCNKPMNIFTWLNQSTSVYKTEDYRKCLENFFLFLVIIKKSKRWKICGLFGSKINSACLLAPNRLYCCHNFQQSIPNFITAFSGYIFMSIFWHTKQTRWIEKHQSQFHDTLCKFTQKN